MAHFLRSSRILHLSGCAAKVLPPTVHSMASATMPTLYDIPVAHEAAVEPPATMEASRDMTIITVPSSTVPTVIYVEKKKTSLAKKLFPSRKEDTVNVVASAPNVTVEQPSVTPWWWYAAGTVSIMAVLYMVIQRFASTALAPIKTIYGIITSIFKRG